MMISVVYWKKEKHKKKHDKQSRWRSTEKGKREAAPTNGQVQRGTRGQRKGSFTLLDRTGNERKLWRCVCVCWCSVCALNSPGLCMRSSSLTERALTTPPTWTRKPGGKDVKVKKGNSCKIQKQQQSFTGIPLTSLRLRCSFWCSIYSISKQSTHMVYLFLANAFPPFSTAIWLKSMSDRLAWMKYMIQILIVYIKIWIILKILA